MFLYAFELLEMNLEQASNQLQIDAGVQKDWYFFTDNYNKINTDTA